MYWYSTASLVKATYCIDSFIKMGWPATFRTIQGEDRSLLHCHHYHFLTTLLGFAPVHEAVRNCIVLMRPLTKKCLIWLLVKLVPNNSDRRVTTEIVAFKAICINIYIALFVKNKFHPYSGTCRRMGHYHSCVPVFARPEWLAFGELDICTYFTCNICKGDFIKSSSKMLNKL